MAINIGNNSVSTIIAGDDITNNKGQTVVGSREVSYVMQGDQTIYQYNRTYDNYLRKYGFISSKVSEAGSMPDIEVISNPEQYSGDKYTIESITDFNEVLSQKYVSFNIKANNISFWNSIYTWFKNNNIDSRYFRYNIDGVYRNGVFALSDVQNLEFNIDCKDDNGKTTNWGYVRHPFYYSKVQEIIIHIKSGQVSSGNGFFGFATELNSLVWDGAPMRAKDQAGIFEECRRLRSTPENIIDWSDKDDDSIRKCTNMHYAFSGCAELQAIPSAAIENPASSDYNVITPNTFIRQMFSGTSSLTTVGPIIDMKYVQLTRDNCLQAFDCPKCTHLLLKNLSNGSWYFDNHKATLDDQGNPTIGTTGDYLYGGNLPLLDETSVQYLFNNLVDLAGRYTGRTNTVNSFFVQKQNNTDASIGWTAGGTKTNQYDIYRYYVKLKYYSTADGDTSTIHTTAALNTKLKVTGLTSGMSIMLGDTTVTKDGVYPVTNTKGTDFKIKLLSNDASTALNTKVPDDVNIQVSMDDSVKYDPEDPLVHEADLYCPTQWNQYITSEMIDAAKMKNWTVYVGGNIREQ